MQQVIAANQIVLQEQMEKFLQFFEKQHNNNSPQFSPPPKQNSIINVMYLHAAVYRSFFTAQCTPMHAGDYWHHCNSGMKHHWPMFVYVNDIDDMDPHHSPKVRLNAEFSSATPTKQQT